MQEPAECSHFALVLGRVNTADVCKSEEMESDGASVCRLAFLCRPSRAFSEFPMAEL